MLSVKVHGKVPSDFKGAISFEAIFKIVLSTKFVAEGRNCKHLFGLAIRNWGPAQAL